MKPGALPFTHCLYLALSSCRSESEAGLRNSGYLNTGRSSKGLTFQAWLPHTWLLRLERGGLVLSAEKNISEGQLFEVQK